jgi:SAM-dependent methyltransferase
VTTDPRDIVRKGYDLAAAEYARWLTTSVVDAARPKYQERFCELLPEGSTVLELGCGGGGPTTERFAQRFALTGIDISKTQVELSRSRLPSATFIEADMTQFVAAPSSFDGIAAFYSLIHLPQGELPGMLARISRWLRPGGVFVASIGARGTGEHFEPDWLAGAAMYWSGYSQDDTMRFLQEAGLMVIEATAEAHLEEGEEAPFLWLVARKPDGSRLT